MSTNKRSGESGTVSVYLIIVLVPIFVFVTILIDYARIGAAGRETELAAKAGIRSAMSSFDSKLQSYGLYGLAVTDEQAREMFAKAAASSVPGAAGGYMDTAIVADSIQLQTMVSLAYPDVFRRQVLEEMKYRAPIEFTLEVADKLKKTGISTKLTNGKTYSEDAGRLESLIQRREEALDSVWESFDSEHKMINNEYTANGSRLKELNGLASQIGLNSLEDVRNRLSDAKARIQSLEQSQRDLDGGSIAATAEAKEALARQLQELRAKEQELERLLQLLLQYAALIAAARIETGAAFAAVTDHQTSIDNAVKEANQANLALRTEWNRLNQAPENSAAIGGNAESAFGAVRVLPDEFFTELQTDIASIAALFGAYNRDIQAAISYSDDKLAIYEAKNEAYYMKSNAVYNARLAEEQQRQARNEQVRAKKRQLWSAIGDVLNQAKQAIGGCPLVTEGSQEGIGYERLRQSELKYLQATETSTQSGEAIVELNDPKHISGDSLRLGGLIAEALVGARDTSFINEFALSKFNYRTFGIEKAGDGQVKPAATLSGPGTHPLSTQEAEYILYGFSSCGTNIASAYGEMFAIRLAIRTIERLSDPKNELLQLGSPLLILLAAAVEGAVDALQDMHHLVQGDEVPLSSKLGSSIRLSYKDYLRLLLFLHGGTEAKLARMQSLIELNTGIDLARAATLLQANTDSTVKLWFLPGAVKLLGLAGLSPCSVEGGRCRIHRTVSLSY